MADDYTPFSAADPGYWEDPRTAFRRPQEPLRYNTMPQMPQFAPYRGELKNPAPRPGDTLSLVYEALSPTQGAYSMGQAAGGAWMAGREGRYGEALGELAPLLAAAIPVPGAKGVKVKGREMLPRELEGGFYSQALEAAKNLQRQKGPAQGFLNDLQKAGVKKTEMEATRLAEFFAANPNPTKEQLVQHLRDNRVQVREGWYGDPMDNIEVRRFKGTQSDKWGIWDTSSAGMQGGRLMGSQEGRWVAGPFATEAEARAAVPEVRAESGVPSKAKWAEYSLDPSNPTYRETVIHLPLQGQERLAAIEKRQQQLRQWQNDAEQAGQHRTQQYAQASEEYKRLGREKEAIASQGFRGGHWQEPSVIAHARTSIQKDAQGRPVFLVDELQSDWGQKLRDGGARDEAKIAAIRQQMADIEKQQIESFNLGYGLLEKTLQPGSDMPQGAKELSNRLQGLARNLDAVGKPEDVPLKWQMVRSAEALDRLSNDLDLRRAELRTAEAATPGHPLVNTTDQWTTTALRKLIQQAVENKAEGIALTPGQIQNERFGLEKHIRKLEYHPEIGELVAHRADVSGDRPITQMVKPEELHTHIGKEAADRLLASRRDHEGFHAIEGDDLRMGGQGMRHAYDRMYPKMLESQLKRLDPQWPGRGTTSLWTDEKRLQPGSMPAPYGYPKEPEGTPFSYFPLTPRIREEVAKGLPLFSLGALAAPGLMKTEEDDYTAHESPFGSSPW